MTRVYGFDVHIIIEPTVLILSHYHADSIRSVASTIAYGTMSYYTGNITNTPEVGQMSSHSNGKFDKANFII